ncbi:YidB family protein [Pararhizobium sp. PWRC1-1]|uniref:YidB family protein n=1 Tax=Pararhizobium sp. PWRC1-1 TaxID=2804566 RepID=UPI003CE691F4
MSRSAMTALLSVLAVAGFQKPGQNSCNARGSRWESLAQRGSQWNVRERSSDCTAVGRHGRFAGWTEWYSGGEGLGDLLRGTAGAGGILSGGLGGLLDQFSQTGHGETAKSWVQDGPHSEIDTERCPRLSVLVFSKTLLHEPGRRRKKSSSGIARSSEGGRWSQTRRDAPG